MESMESYDVGHTIGRLCCFGNHAVPDAGHGFTNRSCGRGLLLLVDQALVLREGDEFGQPITCFFARDAHDRSDRDVLGPGACVEVREVL